MVTFITFGKLELGKSGVDISCILEINVDMLMNNSEHNWGHAYMLTCNP